MAGGPRRDILGLGTVFVDHLVHVAGYPAPDAKAAIRGESTRFGGQIACALAAAARLGARCAYVGVLGGDEASSAMIAALRAGEVECLIRHQDGARPGRSIVIVDDTTHTRTILFNRDGTVPPPPELIPRELLSSAKVLLVDQLATEAALAAADCARELAVPLVADPEWPDAPWAEEFMAQADHLVVGRDFAAAVTGQADPAGMASELHRRRPRACTAVTAGRAGCYYAAGADSPRVHHQPAFEVPSVETTGCGDVFHGAYVSALARGHSVAECVRTASAAAAVYAQRPNGWEYLPTADDVRRLLESSERPAQ